MGRAIGVVRRDLTAVELRKAASREQDGAAARRILAIALVLAGMDRAGAARSCGMDRQTLRDWVQNIWQYLHSNKLANDENRVTSITSRAWTTVTA